MDADDLPEARRLWWPWAVLAASVVEDPAPGVRLEEGVLLLERDGHWLRMQRFARGRALLWSDLGERSDAVPEWAAVLGGTGYVAWFAHGEWDAGDVATGPELAALLALVLRPRPADHDARVDAAAFDDVAAEAASGRLEAAHFAAYLRGDRDPAAGIALLARAADPPPPAPTDAVRDLLREQIHLQMRETPEAERIVVGRPALLVRWARIADLGFAFTHVVRNEAGRLLPARRNVPLPARHRATLGTLLDQLLADETDPDSGAWLFARVRYDGVSIGLDRCFDSWPSWYAGSDGPTLRGLAWEMDQRTPAWRPAWASLLPTG